MSASDSFTLHIDDMYRVNRKRVDPATWSGWAVGVVRQIFESVESRNIFLFLMINLSFAFVELIYGVWTNSLGLITDSFHMFFDCSALVAGLVASLIARWPPNERYGYGYGRAQVIGGFINGLFLIFVAVFVVVEAIERFMDPPHVDTAMLLEVSIVGLFVNILGIVAFSHAHTHGGEPCDHGHSHDAAPTSMPSSSHTHGGGNHGHSHGGKACDGNHGSHGNHGHSHGAPATPSGHGHGHGHAGGGHGHAHNGSAATGVDQDGFATIPLGGPESPSYSGGGGGGGGGGHGHSHGGGHSGHGHSHGGSSGGGGGKSVLPTTAQNSSAAIKGKSRSFVLDGVLLHVIADTLGSVSVIISSLLIMNYGWMTADPVCSMFTAGLILLSVYPLLQGSMMVLMQRTPVKLEPFLLGAYQKISAINGVVQYKDPHFWTLSGNDWYGTMTLVIRSDADDQETRIQAHNILNEIGVNKITIQIERF
eukprot:m.104295 g.104295  ORF g.104295 m.104295 type:complete len:478 (-) comp10520_c1_seq1:1593-3026(-)